MIVVSIGTDRKVFDLTSAVRARMIEYGKLFTELHIIVFALASNNFKAEKISENVWLYPTNSTNRFRYPFDAKKIYTASFKPETIDIVTAQDPFETGIAAWLCVRKTKSKLHVQIHTDFMSKYFKRGSRLNTIRVMIAHWLLPKADGIRTVSDRIKESLAKIDPALLKKTIVLPMYTNREAFLHPLKTTDLHKQYPQFDFIILMASRLTSEKNIGMALQIMRDVVVKHKNAGLIIVGDGPDKKYLQGLALQYHLDRNVIFEPWQSALASYYQTADIFLTTSLYEGYGLTLVEAAASGAPIISSDVGIVRTIVEQGINGFVFDITSKDAFVQSLLALIQDPSLQQELKHAALTISEKKISISYEEYLKKYQEMLRSLVVAE